MKSKTAREAYEIVVSEDKVEAYQAYLVLYPSQSTAPTVRTMLDRRQVMIAWHEAVTINTVASYQAFLAGYGNSDFAATADRLIERARTRSFAASSSAFAAATCPCSQPTNPTLRQQKRTNSTPTQNAPGTNVAIVNPTPVTVYPPPPPIVIPPIVIPPRITVPIPPKPHRDDDKPGRPSGNDKPKPGGSNTGGATTGGSNTDGTSTGTPPILRGKLSKAKAGMNTSVATNTVRSTTMTRSVSSTGIKTTSMVSRQSIGQTGMGRSMGGMSPGMGRSMGSMSPGMGRSMGGMGMSRMSFGRR